MKVIQIMPTVSIGDAVSNDARALAPVIADMGYKTGIYAENIDPRISDSFIHPLARLPKTDPSDVIIFNHSTGTDLCYKLPKMSGRKMMIYHNITPPVFFEEYSRQAQSLTEYGYKGTKDLAQVIEAVIADSSYNASELKKMGYNCDISVRPVLIPFSDYEKTPDQEIMARYSGDRYVNILFVGRLVPNKKQEDVIAAFAYYKKYVNHKSRLILAGSDNGMENYSRKLKKYVEELLIDDVIFTGHISFASILAWYRLADVFLCMSEHEGFCVPLVESMFFRVPIIAYDSSAIGDTLGGAGLLISEKDPIQTALLIDRVVSDGGLRKEIIDGQNERLKHFEYSRVRSMFEQQLDRFIKQKKTDVPEGS